MTYISAMHAHIRERERERDLPIFSDLPLLAATTAFTNAGSVTTVVSSTARATEDGAAAVGEGGEGHSRDATEDGAAVVHGLELVLIRRRRRRPPLRPPPQLERRPPDTLDRERHADAAADALDQALVSPAMATMP